MKADEAGPGNSGAAQITGGAALVAALFVFGLGGAAAQSGQTFTRDTLTLVTAAGERALAIEVADTPEQKALGLMFRTQLSDDAGMLFAYPQPQELTMWMHNTVIPLDMVFIGSDGAVRRIEVRAEPMSDRVISSGEPVVAVLELAGGASERLGLKIGDRVRSPQFKTSGK